MSNFHPGWADEIAETKKAVNPTPKVNTDPESWERLRKSGKKPTRLSEERWAEARRRGGLKGAKAKAAKYRL